MLILPLVTSYANGYDGSMLNGLQLVQGWENYFNHPTGSTLGLFGAIQNIGALCATPIAPYVADIFGRKKCIWVGAVIICIGVALQTASQGFGMFIGSRALIGFGTTFAQSASPLLISEVAYPSHRAGLTSFFNTLWFSGSIVAAWATFGSFRISSTWSWRIPSLLQGIPSLVQVFLIWLLPESPRWLVYQGRDEEAIAILAKYHANGDRNDPLIEFEYQEIKEAIRLEEENKRSVSFLTLFSSLPNLRRMRIIIGIGLFSQWSGNGLISYYLNLVLTAVNITVDWQQTLINACLQMFNLIVATSASFLTERLGRRTLFLWSTAGMCLFYMFLTILGAIYHNTSTWDPTTGNVLVPGDLSAAHAFIAFVFLYSFAYDIAYTPLLVSYTVEILPYQIRAKGVAVLNLTVTAALVFNQYINPIAWGALNWKYYIIYTVWIFAEFVYVYFFAIETKGLTLEECSLLFEGREDALRQAVEHKEEHPDEKASKDGDA